MFDAVIMAGGGKAEPLTELEGVSNKAFIKVNGRTLLGYILDALSRAPSVARIAVVGPTRELAELQQEGYTFTAVEETGGMLDNAMAGLEAVCGERLCLVVTADIPLLHESVVETFLELCAPFDGDFYYPVLSRESCESVFPDTKRTYVRLREGDVTGGNLALLNPAWFIKNRHRLEMFIANRKKPLKLLRLLPLSFVAKFLLHRLSIADLETELSRMMGMTVRAVPCTLVEIGTDVDKLSDLEAVRRALSDRR
ncbi:MAG: nucleotidyltransferase family protein [Bacillota bacterium]